MERPLLGKVFVAGRLLVGGNQVIGVGVGNERQAAQDCGRLCDIETTMQRHMFEAANQRVSAL
jgi:hypothetical protein